MEQTADEIKRLQGCINDLLSVLALPAVWSGHESSQIVSTLLDALLGMLRLDFAYARLSDMPDGAPIEVVRLAQRRNLAVQSQEVSRAMQHWLADNPPASPGVVPHPLGAGEVSVVPLRLGLQDEVGVLVAGSRRSGFPTQIDTLLLRVAVNQATIALQEAQHVREQKRAAEELERRVIARTRQLTAANRALRQEIAERKRAEEALHRSQADLAHATRVLTLGALTASIAHEVNQPLAAVVTNGNACLRWLARETPDLEEARAAVERIIRDGNRAGDVIQRVRTLAKKTDLQKAWLDINDVIQEVVALVQSEVRQHRVALRMELSAALPPVLGDRVQLQQVLLNLLLNGIEAMHPVTDRPRALLLRSQRHGSDAVLVAVQDSGIGLDPQRIDQLFDAFVTTKPNGLGMGLSISRAISEAHGGRLWASPNTGPGATFQFTLPTGGEHVL